MAQSEKFEQFSGNNIANRNLKEKSVQAALYMATGSGVDFILRLISTIILARLLLPEYFGLVAMVTAVTGLVDMIRDLGLSIATVQRNDINHAQVSNLFWINVAGGVFFFFFFCMISTIIAKFYREPRLVSITIAISTGFIFSGLMIQHEALLKRQLKQGQLALIRLVSNLLSLIVALILALHDYSYWALVWREVVRNIIIFSGVWISCRWIPGLPNRNGEILSLLKFGRDISITNIFCSIIMRLDGLLIGRFFGAFTLGIYRQAYQLMMVPIEQMNFPIMSVAQPALSRLQFDADRYRRYYQKIVHLISLATIPLGLFVAVYAEEIILLVLGDKWVKSAVFLRIFAAAAVIRPSIGTSGIVLITCGQSKRYMVVEVVHFTVLLILMLIGILWGAEGIALANVMRSVLLMVPTLYYSFMRTPVTMGDFFKATRSAIVAGIGMMAMIVTLIKLFPLTDIFLRLSIGGVVSMFTYLTILILLPGSRGDVVALYKDVLSSFQQKRLSGKEAKLRAV